MTSEEAMALATKAGSNTALIFEDGSEKVIEQLRVAIEAAEHGGRDFDTLQKIFKSFETSKKYFELQQEAFEVWKTTHSELVARLESDEFALADILDLLFWSRAKESQVKSAELLKLVCVYIEKFRKLSLS